MSVLLDLADALADSLAEASWSTMADPVTVYRENWPRVDVEDLQEPTISVVPAAIESTRIGRRSMQHDYQLFVYVARHAPADADADEMLVFAEEVIEQIEEHAWATVAPAVSWPEGITTPQEVTIELNPGEALRERNVWRQAITVVYRSLRSY